MSAGGNAQRAARSPFGDGGEPGEFYFRPAMHEPGDKVVLGKSYKESGVAEGEQVLASLARSPATANTSRPSSRGTSSRTIRLTRSSRGSPTHI